MFWIIMGNFGHEALYHHLIDPKIIPLDAIELLKNMVLG